MNYAVWHGDSDSKSLKVGSQACINLWYNMLSFRRRDMELKFWLTGELVTMQLQPKHLLYLCLAV